MTPRAWRQHEGLTLVGAAKRLGCSSASCVLRYERGEREAPNSITRAYERESSKAVTSIDLDAVRKKWLATKAKQSKAAEQRQ